MVAIILHLFLSQAFAKDILVIQQRSKVGDEQVGITVDGTNAQMTSNSNFLWSQKKLRLGIFEKQLDLKLKKDFQSPIPLVTGPPAATGAEDIKVFWNGKEVQNFEQRKYWIRVAKDQLKDPTWTLKQGQSFDLDQVRTTCKNLVAGTCRNSDGFIHLY